MLSLSIVTPSSTFHLEHQDSEFGMKNDKVYLTNWRKATRLTTYDEIKSVFSIT